jgi:hypothetical protein
MTYRTLNEARTIRNDSNSTLRFPRTARDAGITGKPVDDEPGPLGMLAWVVGLSLAFFIFLVVVLSQDARVSEMVEAHQRVTQ